MHQISTCFSGIADMMQRYRCSRWE